MYDREKGAFAIDWVSLLDQISLKGNMGSTYLRRERSVEKFGS